MAESLCVFAHYMCYDVSLHFCPKRAPTGFALYRNLRNLHLPLLYVVYIPFLTLLAKDMFQFTSVTSKSKSRGIRDV